MRKAILIGAFTLVASTSSVWAASTSEGCDPEILKEIVTKNTELRRELIDETIAMRGEPTTSHELDCISSLMNVDFSFSIPSFGAIAASVFDQVKEAACQAIADKSNEVLSSAGLDYGADLGTSFKLPGTSKTITVDGPSGGIGAGSGAGTSSGSTGSGISASTTTSSNGSISGSGSASSSASSNDLGSILDGVF